jgi:hypothetical protein
MKTTFTKKERLAIYKKLLKEVDIPVTGQNTGHSGYYLCWKLYIEMVGLEQFLSEPVFGKTELVLLVFPEFKNVFESYRKSIFSNNDQRKEALKETILLCKPEKKIKLKQLKNWLGDDDKDELKEMLLKIANGEYLPETLREDILSSQ